MKPKVQYRILAVLGICCSSFAAYAQAQAKVTNTIELDTLTKIVSLLAFLGGLFLAYVSLKTANKIAVLKTEVTETIAKVREDFRGLLHAEVRLLEVQIHTSGKEIEVKMATRHDVNNAKQVYLLHQEVTNLKLKSLEDKLDMAAQIYKRDRTDGI